MMNANISTHVIVDGNTKSMEDSVERWTRGLQQEQWVGTSPSARIKM